MKNLHHIQIIRSALNKQKEKIELDIARINRMIKNKKMSIKKMLSYQNEYSDEKKFTLSKCVPLLNKNLDTFKRKLNNIIIAEEHEIDQLMKIRASKMEEAEKIHQKIQVMDGFKEKKEKELVYEAEKSEQVNQDEMSSEAHKRKDHD